MTYCQTLKVHANVSNSEVMARGLEVRELASLWRLPGLLWSSPNGCHCPLPPPHKSFPTSQLWHGRSAWAADMQPGCLIWGTMYHLLPALSPFLSGPGYGSEKLTHTMQYLFHLYALYSSLLTLLPPEVTFLYSEFYFSVSMPQGLFCELKLFSHIIMCLGGFPMPDQEGLLLHSFNGCIVFLHMFVSSLLKLLPY